MKIFDIHHHVGELRELSDDVKLHGDNRSIIDEIEEDYKHRIKKMDEFGVTHACLLPANSYPMEKGIQSTREVNDKIAKYRDYYSEKFPVAMGTVELSHGQESLYEIDRIHHELKLNGVVFHHRFQGGAINDPIMWPILERVKEYKLKVFVHVIAESTLESPWRLEVLADEFPDITFVALDAFSSPNQSQWMIYLAKKHTNILFETGFLSSVGNSLGNFINVHGVDRLIYGSDCYVNPSSYTFPFPLFELQKMGLNQEDLNKILYQNAFDYFGL